MTESLIEKQLSDMENYGISITTSLDFLNNLVAKNWKLIVKDHEENEVGYMEYFKDGDKYYYKIVLPDKTITEEIDLDEWCKNVIRSVEK